MMRGQSRQSNGLGGGMKRILGLVMACMCLAAPAWGQVQAENAFALDLYGQLAAQKGNFTISPYSVSTALSMVYAGAKGETAAQMGQALHLPPRVVPGAQAPVLAAADELTFRTANALWLAPHYPAKPGFVAVVRDDFGGKLQVVDFTNSQGAADEINAWVAAQTAHKIQNLVAPPMFSAATRMVLTNAVYFKASWLRPFEKEETRPMPFHTPGGREVQVDMMNTTAHFSFLRRDGMQMVSLPYKGDAALVVILPDRDDGLAALEAKLTPALLQTWLDAAQPARVALSLPKFKETSTFDMNDTLQNLGMRQVFDPAQADLTGIAAVPGERLFVSDVVHKAYIDVNENGTEAAAATAVVMMTMSMPMPEAPPVPFVADHPFLYLIRASSTGAILFIGRVDDPTGG
jgi:serpin B